MRKGDGHMIVMADTLLTLEEVAEILRVSKSTVQRYIAQRKLEAVRVGGRFRVRSEALDRYIDRNTRTEDKK
jgi:excisionase family DNA binding protein